nr:7780_t:CDS:2 [Entrophospora candida]
MSGKSRNNRRKTQGRFTTNPTQYLQFQNRDKYDHIIHEGHITIINKKAQDLKEVFDYVEACRYLEIGYKTKQYRFFSEYTYNNNNTSTNSTSFSVFTVCCIGISTEHKQYKR